MKLSAHLLIATLMVGMVSLAIPVSAVAQSIGHSLFMRGSIVDMTGETATICIGKADGAFAGQTLSVVRISSVPGGKAGSQMFRRTDVGSVKIVSLVDDHFARASVLSGKVAKNDLVELRRDGSSAKATKAASRSSMPKEMTTPGRAERMQMKDEK